MRTNVRASDIDPVTLDAHIPQHPLQHRIGTMPEDERVRENRLRRKIGRMGYILMKSRARDPDALTYGGFQIVDPETKGLAAGWGNANRGYALDLDDVEAWIREATAADHQEGQR